MTAPRFAHCWAELAAVARDMLARRVADDPGKVREGKLTQAQAEERQFFMAQVVAQWLWVLGQGEEPIMGPVTHRATLNTLAEADPRARARAAKAAAKHGPDSEVALAAQDYADCVAALAWHQRPVGECATPHIVFIHRCNLALRAMRTGERQDRAA